MFAATCDLEILPITNVFDDKEGNEFLVKCPHCDRVRGIEKDLRLSELGGEQYQDNLCHGWFEIAADATLVRDIENL